MKKYEAILFDLDGTLIHLPQEEFSKGTTMLMAKLISPELNVDARSFIKGVTLGIEAMIRNDGSRRNSEAFYAVACPYLGGDKERIDRLFAAYYQNEFKSFRSLVTENVFVNTALAEAHRLAERVILATLPVFPRMAQKERLSWIGLTHGDFDLVTDYENCRFSKPSPEYYKDILDQFHLFPEKCMMVGNDVSDDILPAQKIGMQTYLVTDCLLNGHLDARGSMRGSFEDFTLFLKGL